jgi:hypothetical protein
MTENIIYQDNQSTILLKKMAKALAAREPATLTFAIFLLPTELHPRKSLSNIALLPI